MTADVQPEEVDLEQAIPEGGMQQEPDPEGKPVPLADRAEKLEEQQVGVEPNQEADADPTS